MFKALAIIASLNTIVCFFAYALGTITFTYYSLGGFVFVFMVHLIFVTAPLMFMWINRNKVPA